MGAPLAVAMARLLARVAAVEGDLAVLRRAARLVAAAPGDLARPEPPQSEVRRDDAPGDAAGRFDVPDLDFGADPASGLAPRGEGFHPET